LKASSPTWSFKVRKSECEIWSGWSINKQFCISTLDSIASGKDTYGCTGSVIPLTTPLISSCSFSVVIICNSMLNIEQYYSN
jgi:hypothetical protein